GCCKNNVCTPPTAQDCGKGGAACSPCANGDQCLNGACSGCAMNCQQGCCAGNVCIKPPTAQNCGANAGACVACDPVATDTCVNGGCKCGANAPCGAGQQCVNGTCVCNANSCANGCCSNQMCLQPSKMSCGTGGGACVTCDPRFADGCVNGGCSCGG